MAQVFDLRAETRFKNNILHGLIYGKFIGVKEASIGIGVSYPYLLEILSLKRSPNYRIGKTGEVRRSKSAVKIAEFFALPFEEVFPETLYALCLPAIAVRVFQSPELLSLSAAASICDGLPSPETAVIRDDLQSKLLRCVYKLRPTYSLAPAKLRKYQQRNLDLFKMRFGFDGDGGLDYEQIGKRLGVSKTRVAQIEARIMRCLRHPNHSELLAALQSFVNQQTPRALDS